MTAPLVSPSGGRSIRVSVTLKGMLEGRAPGGRTEVELTGGTAAETLIGLLGLPPSSYLFVVNGRLADRGAPLNDGDHVQIHPPMAGG